MSSIVIASKSNSLYLAECEVLAEFLAKNLPSFQYSVIKKHKNEWDEFLKCLKESYGFKRKWCPIVFTVEGELIGDVGEFYDYAQNRFGKVYRVSKDTLNLRAKNNARAVNEEIRCRDKGPNIIEKIQKKLRKTKRKQLVKNYDGFFKTVYDKGIPFKIRYTNIADSSIKFREEIDPNEIAGAQEEAEAMYIEAEGDESPEKQEGEIEGEEGYEQLSPEIQAPSQPEAQLQETKPEGDYKQQDESQVLEADNYDHGEGDDEHYEEDIERKPEVILPAFPFDVSKGTMSYQEFESFYKDEIEGNLNRREAIRAQENIPINEEHEEEKEGEGDNEEKKLADESEPPEGEGEEIVEKQERRKEIDREEQEELEREQRERERIEQQVIELSLRQQESWKNYEEIMLEKGFVVVKDNNYILAVHPTPPMQDVLMLFYQDTKGDSDDLIPYKDYGLRNRLPKIEIPEDLYENISMQEKEVIPPVSKVNTSQFDITNPLTPQEWKLWYDIIIATKGNGFMQVLPVGYSSNQAFKNNLLQIIPKKTKAWGDFKIPLDTMISLREEYYKKENKRLFESSDNRAPDLYSQTNQGKDQYQNEVDLQKEEILLSEAERQLLQERRRLEDQANEHIYKYSSKNIFTLVEFDFPHWVCILDSSPTDNSLITDFMKISDELQLEKVKHLGITIILSKRWMFAAPLSEPYMKMENGLDLFVDPFSYGGILNIHIKQLEWPETANFDEDKEIAYKASIMDMLAKSCPNDYIPPEEPIEPEQPTINESEGEPEPVGEGDKEEGKDEE